MPAKLTVHVPGSASLMRVIADDAAIVLGRDLACDLPVAHESVSRRHVRVEGDSGKWLIHDLGSKNGTRVEGDRIESAVIASTGWFVIGDVFCELQTIDDAQRTRIAARVDERRHASTLWSARLDETSDEADLLATLMKGIVELADCQRGFFLMTDAANQLRIRACYGLSPLDLAGTRFSGSRSAVDRVIAERRAVFLSDGHDRVWLQDRGSVVAQGIQALACLPIEYEGELLGIAYADTNDSAREFTQLDAELLLAFAGHAAASLAVARLDRRLAALTSWLSVDARGTAHARGDSATWTDLASSAAGHRDGSR